jgi:hypothetical protein
MTKSIYRRGESEGLPEGWVWFKFQLTEKKVEATAIRKADFENENYLAHKVRGSGPTLEAAVDKVQRQLKWGEYR